MAQQAQDTFVTEIDGGVVVVQKGQVLPDRHPAVKRDTSGVLFAQLDMDEASEARRSRRAKPKADAVPGDSAGDGDPGADSTGDDA